MRLAIPLPIMPRMLLGLGLLLALASTTEARSGRPGAGERLARQRLARIDPLLGTALGAMRNAHAPFSGVRTGAALSLEGRKRPRTGFNSESQGDLQLCAEQSAMACLPRDRSAGVVKKIAVVSDKVLPCPCGRCLQILSEVGTPRTVVVAATLDGKSTRTKLGDLLPTEFKTATRSELQPFRPLLAEALRVYRISKRSETSRYRPAFGTALLSEAGSLYRGMVIKNTAGTFTPAIDLPLDELARDNALKGHRDRPRTLAFVGEGPDGKPPVPTGDERQHLLDLNPDATVVLYNPRTRAGAVLAASSLLPHPYKR
jgi:cytidine deaminase